MAITLRPYRENLLDAIYQWFWTFFLSSAPYEYPCVTHRFNYQPIDREALRHFDEQGLVLVFGDQEALTRSNWRWHFPVFGGWRRYVALTPRESTHLSSDEWFLGWDCDDGTVGCSRIPLRGTCRARIGPTQVRFFGITEHGDQVRLRRVIGGTIGEGGPTARDVLL